METTTKTFTMKKLTAHEGCWLIAVKRDEAVEPYFAKTVYLGSRASEADYREITDEERAAIADQWQREHGEPTEGEQL